MRAIVKTPSTSLAQGLTSQPLGAADYERALEQHIAYRAALEGLGFQVTVLAADDLPDSCFVEDMAVVGPADERTSQKSFVIWTRSEVRAAEQPAIQEALTSALPHFEQARIEAPGILDGGDILRMGKRWLVGLTGRTNESGFRQFQSAVETFGYQALAIPTPGMLHLKTGVSRLDDATVLVVPSLQERFSELGYSTVVIDPEDWHAANGITVGKRMLIPAGHPRVSEALRAKGYELIEVELDEFKKQDGGATCLSILFP